ncbi:MAG TPA: hypothetical protein VG605_08590, partial [Puia sp.]|nr:hypothetical protein [Puia sp.]
MYILLKYNEEKIAKQAGRCIYAGNFLKDPETLSKKEKSARFNDLMVLDPQAESKAVSLKVEFAPGEKLPDDDLIDITRDLLHHIGYGSQPYL